MKNIMFFLASFCMIFLLGILPEIVHGNERNTKAYGYYINAYTGTKVAVCLGDIEDCTLDYIPGNESISHGFYGPKIELEFIQLRNAIPKYKKGKLNPKFTKLYKPTHIRM